MDKSKIELEDKISELRREYTFKIYIEDHFVGVDKSSYLSGNKRHVNFNNPKREDICKILEHFEPTKMRYEFSHSSEVVLESQFRMELQNSIRDIGFRIMYESNDVDVWINLDIDRIEGFINKTSRPVYDTEHHYFGGTSMKRIREMRIDSRNFKGREIGWYGGNRTLVCEEQVAEIMKSLTEKDWNINCE